jgi:hypothetical protein
MTKIILGLSGDLPHDSIAVLYMEDKLTGNAGLQSLLRVNVPGLMRRP